MTAYGQARAWLDQQPAAVSGQGGHSQTYHVACVLAQGFGLGDGDVFALLGEYNQRCTPPWNESELRHKASEAMRAPPGDRLSRGYMLKNAPGRAATPPRYVRATRPAKAQPARQCVRPLAGVVATDIPDAIQDGTRSLIRACFREGEGIRIANAALNDDGREIPANEGPCLSREEWLRKLDDVKGDPNKIWSSSKKTGIYITINPLHIGGSKDSDVTCFRHALVEFDAISPEEQWRLYQSSRLPCAAVISSGGKSIHAWVTIDAKDRAEYDERVKILYDHFERAGYGIDTKNKNPSRFSRLPNCVRFNARQELLALGIGAESFTAWLQEQQSADLEPSRRLSQLLDANPDTDPDCILGFDGSGRTLGYLGRGMGAWIIGASGIGKSTLLTHMAVGWAQGKPVFGIRPVRALRSLIVQAENAPMDLSRMALGISAAYGLDFDELGRQAIDDKLLWQTETTKTGAEFVDWLHRLIDRDKPDLVWVDPLLSFAGIDVSKQEQATHFLRHMLGPLLKSTGIVLLGMHHTGKPKMPRDMKDWGALDFAYSGIGSSELVNWARAIMVLWPHGNGVYELKLAKRGGQSGASHPDGKPAYNAIWLQQGRGTIKWEHIPPPAEPEPTQRQSKQPKPPPGEAYYQVLVNGPEPTPWDKISAEIPATGEKLTALGDLLESHSRVVLGKRLCARTCRDVVVSLLVKNGKIIEDRKTKLFRLSQIT